MNAPVLDCSVVCPRLLADESVAGADAILRWVGDSGAAESETVMRLAREHRIFVYDALCLELAIRQQRPLATQDRALAKATMVEEVRVLG